MYVLYWSVPPKGGVGTWLITEELSPRCGRPMVPWVRDILLAGTAGVNACRGVQQKKCREIAKRIWERQPDFTIAGMINRSEIVRQARQSDGKPYSEMTIRNWIRDLCPNRKPGRRPAKNVASGRSAEFQSTLQ
jgi:hypothetical protein